MKSIKKIALVAVVAIMSVGFASAQVGIQAGYSSLKSTESDSKAIGGFHVGPVYNMTIQGPISLQYGLLYNMYMQKEVTPKVLNSWAEGKVNLHQLDIPVRVAATFPLSGGLSVFGFAGPNFNIGIAGKSSLATFVNGEKSDVLSYDGQDVYEDKDLSRFNLQLGLGAGIQYNNIGVKFSYDFGMLDMHKSENINYKDNGMKIGLFYNF